MNKLRLGIIGCGYLGNIIADAWMDGLLDDYELVGVAGRTESSVRSLAEKTGCTACTSIDELIALKPDYIAEAASIKAVQELVEKALPQGINLAILSIGAFADQDFYQNAIKVAQSSGAKIHIASGAIGGFDVLRTIALMGQAKTSFQTKKGPASLQGTPVFQEQLMVDTTETKVFSGTAKEAIALLPTRVNVSIAASIASEGPQNTDMEIYSVPGMAGDDHKITSSIDGVKAVIDIYSRTSEIAGWSVVALLQNITSPIVF
ncbi:MAG: aspartate dehydrogenase domain-containing protein [Lachnospiraceae bacterium]